MDGIRRSHRQTVLLIGVAALAAVALLVGTRVAGDGPASTVRAGGSASASAAEPAPAVTQDPCTLVTEVEAQAALGSKVTRTGVGRTCTFTVTTGGAFRSLSVVSGLEGAEAANFAEVVRTYAHLAGAQLAAQPGVGDEAYSTIDRRASQLIARAGDRVVTIVLLGVEAPPEQRIATMTDLARTALSRLA
jgi:hypothetical protein